MFITTCCSDIYYIIQFTEVSTISTNGNIVLPTFKFLVVCGPRVSLIYGVHGNCTLYSYIFIEC